LTFLKQYVSHETNPHHKATHIYKTRYQTQYNVSV